MGSEMCIRDSPRLLRRLASHEHEERDRAWYDPLRVRRCIVLTSACDYMRRPAMPAVPACPVLVLVYPRPVVAAARRALWVLPAPPYRVCFLNANVYIPQTCARIPSLWSSWLTLNAPPFRPPPSVAVRQLTLNAPPFRPPPCVAVRQPAACRPQARLLAPEHRPNPKARASEWEMRRGPS